MEAGQLVRGVLPALLFGGALVGCTPAQDETVGLERHTVEVDGHPMAVWEKSPANPWGTVLLLHGRTWSSLPDFDLQVQGEDLSLMDGLVAEGISVYALDARGYGETPRDETQWLTPDRASRDVEAVLRWIRERDGTVPALFGWSYGSMVAQLTAQREEELVSGLILFGYPVDPDREPAAANPASEEPPRIPTTAEAAASDFTIPGAISQAAIDEYVRHALEADPIRMDWRNLEEWNELDPSEVRVPTLLLQGEMDPFAPTSRQAAFFSRLGTPDRMWVTIAGGDHAAHLETPRARFIQELVSFMNRPEIPASGEAPGQAPDIGSNRSTEEVARADEGSATETGIRIELASISVEDQDAALRFYTEVLGFEVKENMPVGEYRWLTVTSPAGAAGVELLLEPVGNPTVAAFQKAIYEQGIPATIFFVSDLRAEHERLADLGVVFTTEPQETESGWLAVFDDTCGNLILLHEG